MSRTVQITLGWRGVYYMVVAGVAVYHLGWWALIYVLLSAVHPSNSR